MHHTYFATQCFTKPGFCVVICDAIPGKLCPVLHDLFERSQLQLYSAILSLGDFSPNYTAKSAMSS